MMGPRPALLTTAGSLWLLLAFATGARGQLPRPEAEPSLAPKVVAERLASEGRQLLYADDVVAAERVFQRLRRLAPDDLEGMLGLGQVHLELGQAGLALRYSRAAERLAPDSDRAVALEVRALLRAREFERALEVSQRGVERFPGGGPELWAAHASALFRLQHTSEAADAYRHVLKLDPMQAEAHVRLGSGLTDPTEAARPAAMVEGVDDLRHGDVEAAILRFHAVLRHDRDNPVAHRLLGDALLARRAATSMAHTVPEFAQLLEAVPLPSVAGLPVERFLPAYRTLRPSRKRVATRALALFGSYLPRLVSMGGRHDLLRELERTTDAPSRASLRGKRTFDGRVWDDVRGIGGLRAATGIEALDDVEQFGYDTLTHEITHQAHLYAFDRLERRRVRELFEAARAENRFLDYYAANNEAEYFGQGVEAFVSFGKRPGREPTHGHTRFELYRVDPELHDFIAGVVDWDPLRDPAVRAKVLPIAIEVALRCGRPADAVVAAQMMAPGPDRERLLAQARRARLLAASY